MTIAELIAKLQELPQDLPVYYQCEDETIKVDEVIVRTVEVFDRDTILQTGHEKKIEAAVIW